GGPDGDADGNADEHGNAVVAARSATRTDARTTARARPPERERLLARAREWLGEAAGARVPGEGSGADTPAGPARVLGVAGSPVPPAVAGLGAGTGAVAVLVPAAVPLGTDELDLVASAAVPPAGVVFVVAGRVLGEPLRAAVARHRAVLAEFAPGFERCPFVAGAAPGGELHSVLAAAGERRACADVEVEWAACAVAAELARRRRAAQREAETARRRAGDLRRRRAEAADRRSRSR